MDVTAGGTLSHLDDTQGEQLRLRESQNDIVYFGIIGFPRKLLGDKSKLIMSDLHTLGARWTRLIIDIIALLSDLRFSITKN